MANAFASFDSRLRKIDRKHRKMADGYTTRVGSDGLIIIRPRHRGPRVPVKGLLLLVVGFFALKALMLAQVGLDGYNDRLSSLQTGTLAEQAGGWVMQADPVTQWLASQVASLLPK